MTLFIGQEAPEFVSPAIMPDNSFSESFSLKKHLQGRVGVVFFYAMNFSYLCPAEIIAIQNRLGEFQRRNAMPVAVSCDTHLAHLEWKNKPVAHGGIGQVQFPLVSDAAKVVARGYDVLINNTLALRATFIIDRNFTVRYQAVHDLPMGRNIDEILRTIDMLQHHEKTGYVCPPGWQAGREAIRPTAEGTASFLNRFGGTL